MAAFHLRHSDSAPVEVNVFGAGLAPFLELHMETYLVKQCLTLNHAYSEADHSLAVHSLCKDHHLLITVLCKELQCKTIHKLSINERKQLEITSLSIAAQVKSVHYHCQPHSLLLSITSLLITTFYTKQSTSYSHGGQHQVSASIAQP